MPRPCYNASFALICLTGIVIGSAASGSPSRPVQSWSAMAGTPVEDLLGQIDRLPLSHFAGADQPFCASDAEISATLQHDFDEERIRIDAANDIELWGSDLMGTWTMVAARKDNTSCIIASGIGFSDSLDSDAFYRSAGLPPGP